jgi:hypothetical protein
MLTPSLSPKQEASDEGDENINTKSTQKMQEKSERVERSNEPNHNDANKHQPRKFNAPAKFQRNQTSTHDILIDAFAGTNENVLAPMQK